MLSLVNLWSYSRCVDRMLTVKRLGVGIRLACEIFGISQACYRYTTKLSDKNVQIADELLQLIDEHKRWIQTLF